MSIPLLNKMPIIFTKDANWVKSFAKTKIGDGSIVVLPSDAVLVELPDICEVKDIKK